MNFTSKDYLPNSEKRIAYLRKIIDGRPVAILSAGPSIKELEKRINELGDADVCYFGFNQFSQEKHILQQIGKHVSVFYRSCFEGFYAPSEGMPEVMEAIINFLNRDEDNMFVSSFFRNTFEWVGKDFDLNQFLSKYDKKLIFFGGSYDRTVPNKDKPMHFISGNTLQMVIQMAVIGKASKIVLFGADGGYSKDKDNFFYKPCAYNAAPPENYILDTNLCFNPIMPLAIRNVCDTYKLPTIEILNCSEHSYYNPFPNISYDDAFEYLITGKKLTQKADKRNPKLSVISTALNTKDFLRETIENLTEQSYPNFEHIIVCEGEDNEIDDVKGRYLRTKWVCEKFDRWHEGLRKGISAARGEYIYYLPPGDSFSNPDWLNICMDILENHPDISLVWGLSQELSEWNGAPGQIRNSEFFHDPPPQGKGFISYWLKKKYLFQLGSFCVRKSVLEECFPSDDASLFDERKAWLAFNYNFNTSGYLPFFVPLVATFHKTYFDQGGHRPQGDPIKMHLPYYVPITEREKVREEASDKTWDMMVKYHNKIRQYRKSVLTGEATHRFKDGFGQEMEGNFSRFSYFFGDIQRWVNRKAPHNCALLVNRTLNACKKHRLGIFRVGVIKVTNRLKSHIS